MDTIQKSSVFYLEKKKEHVGQFQGDCGPFYGACMIQLKMQVPVYVENASQLYYVVLLPTVR
jgi:hypothetical protein